MDKYDYIELVIFDVHSIPRGRMVARRRMMSAVKKGIGLYSAMCYFGVQDQPNACDYFGVDRNYGNACVVPILDTLVDGPKSARGEHKVGQVLCDLRLMDGTMEPSTPRYVAQRQVEKLASLDLSIRSAFELEFAIVDKDGKTWGHESKWCDINILGETQGVLLDMVKEMSESGVHVDTIQTEAGPGQYEVTLDVAEGLEGPDMTSRFKSMSKIFLRKRDLNATFMTKISLDGLCNGFHFNHSLWAKDGTNAFLDTSQPDNLSSLGRHWLAGLITHAPALTALCCPTVNCYRRLHRPWTPTKSNYAVQDRLSAFRLVCESDNNIYIENRIPSSACNPYLVMAGVLAAGMDGVTRKLSLDEVDQDVTLPSDLEAALTSLKDDTVMVEALSKEFVECFTYNKNTFEIENLKDYKTDPELFFAEKKMYFLQL